MVVTAAVLHLHNNNTDTVPHLLNIIITINIINMEDMEHLHHNSLMVEDMLPHLPNQAMEVDMVLLLLLQ